MSTSTAAAEVSGGSGQQVTAVSQTCEAIWRCKDGDEAIRCIQALHVGILHEQQLDAYDPSEAFLALQGAVLRFRVTPENSNENNSGDSKDDKGQPLHQIETFRTLREKALWASAALARNCVGPAWWHQVSQRCIIRQTASVVPPMNESLYIPSPDCKDSRSSEYTPTEIDMGKAETQDSRARSSTPPLSTVTQKVWYPSIPEVLPAAMLRFAATMVPTDGDESCDSSVARAQIVLVVALTSKPESDMQDEHNERSHGDTPDWTIPGVRDEIGDMVLSWLRLSTTLWSNDTQGTNQTDGEAGSQFTLQVSRACTDIFSAAWRPREETCRQLIDYLLGLAKDGIEARGTDSGDGSSRARKKRLVAMSIATEAVAALVVVGSRGLIALDSLPGVVKIFCRLRTFCDSVHLFDAFPVPTESTREEQEAVNGQVALFSSQRELCFADITDLLWVLLAEESSMETTMDTLLSIFAKSSPAFTDCQLPCTGEPWNDKATMICTQGRGAIFVISMALWGKLPATMGISSLRIYWQHVLDTISRTLSSVYALIVTEDEQKDGDAKIRDLNKLARDLILSVCRVMEQEIHGEGGNLSAVEWVSLVTCLKEGIAPRLFVGKEPVSDLGSMLREEATTFVLLLSDYLEVCVSVEDSPFAEYSDQLTLYSVLLRDVVPRLGTGAGARVGSSAIRCWAKFGIFPHRTEGLCQAAAEILGEAFSTSTQGVNVHVSLVRLEALRALTYDGNEVSVDRDCEDHDGSEHSAQSLLELTLHMREQRHSFIESSIIPALNQIMLETPCLEQCESANVEGQDMDASSVGPDEKLSMQDISERLSRAVEVPQGQADLELYAIDLTGRLFRDVTGDRGQRAVFVEILRSVVLNETRKGACRRVLSHTLQTRVAAIIELERCLVVPFSVLHHAHESVPAIISVLCAVVNVTAQPCLRMSVLVLVALDALSRLRVAIDSHIVFRTRAKELSPMSLDQVLLDFFTSASLPDSKNRSLVAETCGAPVLVVRRSRPEPRTSSKTVVDFELIGASLLGLLIILQEKVGKVSTIVRDVRTCMKIVCFDALSSMALTNVCVEIPESITSGVFFPRHQFEIDSAEVQTRSRALGQVSQTVIIKAWERQLTDSGQPERSESLLVMDRDAKCALSQILLLLKSRETEDVVSGCDILCSFLPSFTHLVQSQRSLVLEEVCRMVEYRVAIALKRLTTVSVKVIPGDELRCSLALLAVIHDTLVYGGSEPFLKRFAVTSFGLCNAIVALSPEPSRSCSVHFALRCLANSIDRMDEEQIQGAWRIKGDLACNNDSVWLQSVVNELLDRRSYEIQQKDVDTTHQQYPDTTPSKHESLAVEVDNIERFEVERTPLTKAEPSVAWLCGRHVLITCRVGSSSSRYRGWLELTIRTPSCRMRAMVRLPGHLALRDPEFPGFLWGPRMPNSDEIPDADRYHDVPQDQTAVASSSNEILEKASAVLSRFDAMTQSERNPQPLTEELDTQDHLYAPPDRQTQDNVESTAEPCNSIADWLHLLLPANTEVVSTVQTKIDGLLTSCGIDQAFAPKRLQGGPKTERAITILDRIPVFNTHKVALLYDNGRGDAGTSSREARLLSTTSCSPSFHKFVSSIGDISPTRHLRYYSAGLDVSEYESDGQYVSVWTDEVDSKSPAATDVVVFHVVSLMPNGLRTRKRHVGNDNVLILYSDAGSDEIVAVDLPNDLGRSILQGDFGFVTIYATPLCPNIVRVALRVSSGLPQALQDSLSHLACNHILLEEDAPVFIRNLAIRADTACRVAVDAIDPPSNCLERHRMLNEMKRYASERTG